MAITQSRRAPAKIPILNYEKIHARDPVEVQRLFEACQPPPVGQGTFFLDVRDSSTSKQTLMNLPAINSGMVSYFKQPAGVKMADFRPDVERGFKQPDSFEDTFEIAWDELKACRPLVVAPGLDQCASEISAMSSTCDAITRDVLAALASRLGPGLNEGSGATMTTTTTVSPPQRASDTGLKLCLTDDSVAPWELTAGAHTDFGLLTLLFCDAPVIELRDPAAAAAAAAAHAADHADANRWLLVEPVEGCALVHVADTLQRASGGVLHSPLHRVVQPDGVGPEGTCMTVYYLRPEHEQQS